MNIGNLCNYVTAGGVWHVIGGRNIARPAATRSQGCPFPVLRTSAGRLSTSPHLLADRITAPPTAARSPGISSIVEYHATMEPCSDKFHVDIPDVV
jgi:hypothetical protein